LPEYEAVNEFLMGEPVILTHGLFLDQRYDGQAATECQRTNLGKERTNLDEVCRVT
jgi:hypothetical protein